MTFLHISSLIPVWVSLQTVVGPVTFTFLTFESTGRPPSHSSIPVKPLVDSCGFYTYRKLQVVKVKIYMQNIQCLFCLCSYEYFRDKRYRCQSLVDYRQLLIYVTPYKCVTLSYVVTFTYFIQMNIVVFIYNSGIPLNFFV